MKRIDFRFLLAFSILLGCKSSSSVEEIASEISILEVVSDSTREEIPISQGDQEKIEQLINLKIQDLFKEDLAGDFLDSLDRRYMYYQVDLNEDGISEILVGMTGPFFCGSGGCTLLLLSDQGDFITQFSVVKYPVFVDNESSNGWKNLILYSGGKNRLVQFDGETYPSNPSILPVFERDVDNLKKLLDWEGSETYFF
ncbi:hypothetical protein E4S40_06360 [Algoriphagus kandeliae]|uniref:Lipoprotein n=1 Tax=Algoriphagus kandeliae TaxID=2562278 RepID=A0A4Y9QW93_9BACT|nr:hypothetical protein [Algoriphagus kandeliae]TFV95842.1 hypothetical protein E4S40_06360 [Algoriphagus kandeliae]